MQEQGAKPRQISQPHDNINVPFLARRRSRRAVLVGGAVLLVGVGATGVAHVLSRSGGDSSMPLLDSRTAPPSDLRSFGSPDVRPQIEFSFDDNILLKDRQAVEEGANLALDFLRRELGTYTSHPITYSIKYDTRQLISAETSGNTIAIIIGGQFGQDYPAELKQRIVVGENFNILAREVTRRESVGPWILEEGFPEKAGFAAIIEKGLMSNQDVQNFHMTRIRRSPKLPSIASMGDVVGTNLQGAANSMSYLAVDFLVGPRGVKAIGEYLLALSEKPDMPWEETFQKTFGRTFDQFNNEFETYRQSLDI